MIACTFHLKKIHQYFCKSQVQASLYQASMTLKLTRQPTNCSSRTHCKRIRFFSKVLSNPWVLARAWRARILHWALFCIYLLVAFPRSSKTISFGKFLFSCLKTSPNFVCIRRRRRGYIILNLHLLMRSTLFP